MRKESWVRFMVIIIFYLISIRRQKGLLHSEKKCIFVPTSIMEQTILRLREGDEHAFDELFRAFFPAGRRFIKSFRVDDESADDVMQDVFIRIWDKRHIFENEYHFKSYFYKALRNNTVKHLTRHKTPAELKEGPGIEETFAKIVEVEFNREISRAISLLPEKRRSIIFHSMAGMSIEEIAKKLNISVNTVKAQKQKAYSTLREELKDLHIRILLIIVMFM